MLVESLTLYSSAAALNYELIRAGRSETPYNYRAARLPGGCLEKYRFAREKYAL